MAIDLSILSAKSSDRVDSGPVNYGQDLPHFTSFSPHLLLHPTINNASLDRVSTSTLLSANMLSLISRYRRNATKRPRSPSPSPLVATKKLKHHDHHIEANYELLTSGRYSDCAVACGQWLWNVHQSIVCPRSKFFEVAFNSNFRVRKPTTKSDS